MFKCVITGAAGYGKTSVIRELEKRRYEVLNECATDILKQHQDRTGEDLRQTDVLQLEKLIVEEQCRREAELRGPISFVDRGLPDVLAYCDFYNIELPPEYSEKCKTAHYDKIFILEEIDSLGKEGEIKRAKPSDRRRTQKLLEQKYKELGFETVSVATMPVSERADFILTNLN